MIRPLLKGIALYRQNHLLLICLFPLTNSPPSGKHKEALNKTAADDM